jgi:hypothetical protein
MNGSVEPEKTATVREGSLTRFRCQEHVLLEISVNSYCERWNICFSRRFRAPDDVLQLTDETFPVYIL